MGKKSRILRGRWTRLSVLIGQGISGAQERVGQDGAGHGRLEKNGSN